MNSCPTTVAALLAFALSLNSSGVSCQEPVAVTQNDLWPRPLLVVAPAFPKGASLQMLPVQIRVEGRVTADGNFRSPVFLPAEGREVFVKAISDVLPYWRFRPALERKGCKTMEGPAVFGITFELKAGAPSVSVSSPAVEKVDSAGTSLRGLHLVSPPGAKYPYDSRQAGIEGFAEILVEVDSEGDIASKAIISSVPNALFGEAALEALRNARFSRPDMSQSEYKTACVVLPFNFCMHVRGSSIPGFALPQMRPAAARSVFIASLRDRSIAIRNSSKARPSLAAPTMSSGCRCRGAPASRLSYIRNHERGEIILHVAGCRRVRTSQMRPPQ